MDRVVSGPPPPVPLPTPMMRFKVSGTPSRKEFLKNGRKTMENLLAVLEASGTPFSDTRVNRVLDFGCGCGRTLAWLTRRFPEKEFFGADVDQSMVAWCRQQIRCAQFEVSRPEPPTLYRDEEFDLIFAISVFTHLDEARQLQWLSEFRRLLAPGGTLLVTTHGELVWSCENQVLREEVRRLGTLTVSSRKLQGFFPDWYQTTFHTREWALRTCAGFFGGVTFWPGAFGFQDAIVCQHPIRVADRNGPSGSNKP